MANKKIKEDLTAVTEKAAAICENRENIQPREPLAALYSRKVHIINGLLDLLEALSEITGLKRKYKIIMRFAVNLPNFANALLILC